MPKHFLCLTIMILCCALMRIPMASASGTVEGFVRFAGSPMKKKSITITKDHEVCGKTPLLNEALIIGKNKGLKNAVISIIGTGKKIKGGNIKKLDQDGCRFEPHILVVPVRSKLDVHNSDNIMHNLHTYTIKNDSVNFSQPGSNKLKAIEPDFFQFPEIIPVRCEVHSWMSAYLIVTDNPYISISGPDGSFKIPYVPDGSYKITVWHESLGKHIKDIVVKNGKNIINFELQKKR